MAGFLTNSGEGSTGALVTGIGGTTAIGGATAAGESAALDGVAITAMLVVLTAVVVVTMPAGLAGAGAMFGTAAT